MLCLTLRNLFLFVSSNFFAVDVNSYAIDVAVGANQGLGTDFKLTEKLNYGLISLPSIFFAAVVSPADVAAICLWFWRRSPRCDVE